MHFAARIAAVLALGALVGCGGPAEPVWAPDDQVARYRFVDDGQPSVSLISVVNNEIDAGRHSALLINGSERVLFDPAGSFKYSQTPERNDVLFGMSDRALDVYIDYHARELFDVHIQEVPVSRAVADELIAKVKAYGAVPKAQCALSIGRVLDDTPGFESIPVSFSPNRLESAFAKLPGVTTQVITDDDANDNHGVLIEAEQSL